MFVIVWNSEFGIKYDIHAYGIIIFAYDQSSINL